MYISSNLGDFTILQGLFFYLNPVEQVNGIETKIITAKGAAKLEKDCSIFQADEEKSSQEVIKKIMINLRSQIKGENTEGIN